MTTFINIYSDYSFILSNCLARVTVVCLLVCLHFGKWNRKKNSLESDRQVQPYANCLLWVLDHAHFRPLVASLTQMSIIFTMFARSYLQASLLVFKPDKSKHVR